MSKLLLGDIDVEVVLKDIKNVHLSVHPPRGRVRIAAPSRMSMDNIRLYAISKLDWIKSQRRVLQKQDREPPREFIERESHYVWGRRYLLTVNEIDAPPAVELDQKRLILQVRPRTAEEKRNRYVAEWYRLLLKNKAAEFVAKWEPIIGVKVQRLFIQQMKTRWGSCNSCKHTIRLNTELAKKPLECLEYLVVHEMIHIIEPTHNEHFHALLNHHMPDWNLRRQALNRLPLKHEQWQY